MKPSRVKRAARPLDVRPQVDSFKHRSKKGAEESRLFQPPALAGIQVHGRVQGWKTPSAPLRRLLQAYLDAMGTPGTAVSLQLVDDEDARRLNRDFRGIDAPTDILSFPAEGTKLRAATASYLGELALDLPYAWRHRGRFSSGFGGELAFLILHGLMHLRGWHHDNAAQEKALWKEQDRYYPPNPGLLKDLGVYKPLK